MGVQLFGGDDSDVRPQFCYPHGVTSQQTASFNTVRNLYD